MRIIRLNFPRPPSNAGDCHLLNIRVQKGLPLLPAQPPQSSASICCRCNLQRRSLRSLLRNPRFLTLSRLKRLRCFPTRGRILLPRPPSNAGDCHSLNIRAQKGLPLLPAQPPQSSASICCRCNLQRQKCLHTRLPLCGDLL